MSKLLEELRLSENTGISFSNREIDTLQLRIYFNRFLKEHSGSFYYIFDPLTKTYTKQIGKLAGETLNFLPTFEYAYVILKIENRLEMRIGPTNHVLLAIGTALDPFLKKISQEDNQNNNGSPAKILMENHKAAINKHIQAIAPKVICAGTYVISQGELKSFDDKSGGYNIETTHPDYTAHRKLMLSAFNEFKLPMEKFRPFETQFAEQYQQAPTLLLSRALNIGHMAHTTFAPTPAPAAPIAVTSRPVVRRIPISSVAPAPTTNTTTSTANGLPTALPTPIVVITAPPATSPIAPHLMTTTAFENTKGASPVAVASSQTSGCSCVLL